MIPRNRWYRVMLVLFISLGLHFAAAVPFAGEDELQMASSAAPTAPAKMGSSFADMAQGLPTPTAPEAVEPKPTEDLTKPIDPKVSQTEPPQPIEAETATPTETQPIVDAISEATAPAPDPVDMKKTISVEIPALPTDVAAVVAIAPTKTIEVLETIASEPLPLERLEATENTQPLEVARLDPEPLETIAPTQTVESVDPEALVRSQRPQKRPERTPERTQPRPEPVKTAAQGSSSQNATAGSATTTQDATASVASTAEGRSSQAGNAAADSYPGKVMRRILRVPQPRMSVRATARVNFTIDKNGRLKSVKLIESSGHARLDQAALQIIRRASPFPKPPPGANLSYNIPIRAGG